jgi:hypothetical protein
LWGLGAIAISTGGEEVVMSEVRDLVPNIAS